MSKPCHTPECDNYVGDGSEIGLCKPCYASIRYWHKKSTKQLIQRAHKLHLYGSRMAVIMPSNVELTQPIRTKVTQLSIMPGEYRKPKKGKPKRNAVLVNTKKKRKAA